ncbi:MAG: glycerol-3-phosphate 1-O-acyltransferase PlsY, partial [Deltaproteobacteria bacterium]|nr:glycerol-3-phosphate 1-O-acyltransferase PlsY [Deltaproteobacteria bacterium]
MNHFLFIVIVFAVYLIAAVPTGLVLSKVFGYEDVRNKGSGNIGATNVYRVAGKLPGVLTLIGDILKGLLPILLIKHFLNPSMPQLGIVGAFAILGHCYPIYLKFQGGKGVATALGIFLVLSPFAVLGACVIFVATVSISRFISLGSMFAAITVPLLMLMLDQPEPLVISALFVSLLV